MAIAGHVSPKMLAHYSAECERDLKGEVTDYGLEKKLPLSARSKDTVAGAVDLVFCSFDCCSAEQLTR